MYQPMPPHEETPHNSTTKKITDIQLIDHIIS
jgi:hypothetical protein